MPSRASATSSSNRSGETSTTPGGAYGAPGWTPLTALLAGLDDAQREAVTTPALPLCVLAETGSSKTRVLTRRIAWRCAEGLDDPRRILALTFTRAAAVELSRQTASASGGATACGPASSHAVAWAELRVRAAEAGRPTPALLERPAASLRKVDADLDRAAIAEVATELALAAGPHYPARGLPGRGRPGPPGPPRSTPAALSSSAPPTPSASASAASSTSTTCSSCWPRRWPTTWLRRRPAVALRHLYVDELQDLNPLQHRLLEQWRAAGPILTGVGDPNQSIYGVERQRPRLRQAVRRALPGGATVAIDRSYRSTTPILDLANAVLDAGHLGGVRLVSVRGEGPVPEALGYADDEAEAARPWPEPCSTPRCRARRGATRPCWPAPTASSTPPRPPCGRCGSPDLAQRGRLPFHEEPVVRRAA